MPLPQEYRDQLARTMDESDRYAKRAARRAHLLTLLYLVVWTIVGLGCFGMAMRTVDQSMVRPWFWAGVLFWGGGVVIVLIRAWIQGERRGDW